MNDEHIDWEALDRYLRGEGTAAERESLERWVNADPRRRALAATMRSVGSSEAADSQDWDAQRALVRVQTILALRREGARQVHQAQHPKRLRLARELETRRHGRLLRRSLFGAGVAAAAAAGLFLKARAEEALRPPPDPPAREVVTAPGQRAHIELEDGTRVVLSADGRMRIPRNLATARRREVWLEGEAFFQVTHDTARAFVVHTAKGSAEDLGTEFAVSTYPEVEGMRLAVREGLVALRARPDSGGAITGGRLVALPESVVVLAAGDVGLVNRSGSLEVSRGQSLAPFFAASDGTLALSRVQLRHAIPRLERWYGITIRVRDRLLLSKSISGTFRDESATDVIGVIATALVARATWKENHVTLESNPQQQEVR